MIAVSGFICNLKGDFWTRSQTWNPCIFVRGSITGLPRSRDAISTYFLAKAYGTYYEDTFWVLINIFLYFFLFLLKSLYLNYKNVKTVYWGIYDGGMQRIIQLPVIQFINVQVWTQGTISVTCNRDFNNQNFI